MRDKFVVIKKGRMDVILNFEIGPEAVLDASGKLKTHIQTEVVVGMSNSMNQTDAIQKT